MKLNFRPVARGQAILADCKSVTVQDLKDRQFPSPLVHGLQFKEALAEGMDPMDVHAGPSKNHDVRKATILLVEDEDFVRNITREVLELEGYRVFEAMDAKTGFDLYKQHSELIDLLLTDVVMPGLNGREFAARLLEVQHDLKVIFMSGYTDNAVVREGFSDIRLHYLQKPFTLDTLTEKIAQVLSAGEDPSCRAELCIDQAHMAP